MSPQRHNVQFPGFIWAISPRYVNQSPAAQVHIQHNTLTLTRSDLFHPAACFGQSLWPSSGRDNNMY